MVLYRACFSHRASCSTSPAAGEVPAGATEGDTLGNAPQGRSTAIQDPFQHLASPESNWAGLTESSAGCGVLISACSFSATLRASSLTERHIAVSPSPESLFFFFGVICQSDISPRAFLLASWCWQRPPGSSLWAELGGPVPGTCWAGSHSCAVAGRDT